MRTKKLFYFELENGMIVANDLYSAEGQLVVPADTVLNNSIIKKISACSILEVVVYQPEEKKTVDMIEQSSYSERIRASEDFKVFETNYLDNIIETKDVINDIVNKNSEIDPNTIISGSVNLLNKTGTAFHIFDMLHNMRNYDDSTHVHSVNVGLISAIIGKWLNYDEEDINTLILSGMLHDIGKLTIPIEILTKPGRLTDEEYAIIKTHPLNGYELLKPQHIDNRAKEGCLFHHERCDGSGYPFGLKGNRLPEFAKIVAIADVYDAMTANRVYRQGLCPFDVIKLFEEDGLHRYDPHIMMTFLNNIVNTYINNTIRLNDGTIGEIIMINSMNLTCPIIKAEDKFIDLSKHPELKIEAII